MLSFKDTKDFLCKILNGTPSTENDDYNIIYDLQHRISLSSSTPTVPNTILDSDLRTLYEKISTYDLQDAALYNNNYYEIALDVDSYFLRRNESFDILTDSTNGITYELGLLSPEYSLYLISLLGEKRSESIENRRMFPIDRFKRPLYYHLTDEEKTLTLNDLLPKLLREFSLKITSTSYCTFNQFHTLSTSYCFEFMLKTQISLIEYKDMQSILIRPRLLRNHIESFQLDKAPLRIYNEDVVDYYKMAISSNDPYNKYISFYHVLEYYYDEVFKTNLIRDLKDKLTHPDFSYKKDEKIYELAQFVKNRWKADLEGGQGDELESLKYVIAEYVSIDDLKTRINSYDASSLTYYQTTKVSFCDAPTLPWNDASSIITVLAKRIYYTRNSLIHSKSGKNNQRYKPFRNEAQLNKELPLIQSIAELVIISASKTMQ